jgi:hypothetical protein
MQKEPVMGIIQKYSLIEDEVGVFREGVKRTLALPHSTSRSL